MSAKRHPVNQNRERADGAKPSARRNLPLQSTRHHSGRSPQGYGWIAMISMQAMPLVPLAVAVCDLLPAETGPVV